MKKLTGFASLFPMLLAGAAGSALTLGIYTTWLAPAGDMGPVVLMRAAAPAPMAAATPAMVPTGMARAASAGIDFVQTARRATPSVVHIKSTYGRGPATAGRGRGQGIPHGFEEFFGLPPGMFEGPGGGGMGPGGRDGQGSGSGVIISRQGHIVTNNHVIDDARDIEVILADKRTAKARVIGRDPSTDIAVIQIDEVERLEPIVFGNSDLVEPGQWVVAVGNPFNLESTVTAGIVSAKARSINLLRQRDSAAIESFIQTDAAINPGNSGGALVNLEGQLVGVNTAIASVTGTYAGYAFAVPSNIVEKVTQDLIRYGRVQRGLLGVRIQDVNAQVAREHDLKVSDGVYVASVAPRSAAAAAGIKAGDVILKIDDQPTLSSAALQEQVARRRPGDKLAVTVNRGGKLVSIPTTLRNVEGTTSLLEAKPVNDQRPAAPTDKPLVAMGLELEPASERDLRRLGIKGGVRVKGLSAEGTAAQQTDMRPGFIITRVDKQPVTSPAEAERLLSKARGGVMVEGVYPDYPGSYYYAFGSGRE